MGFPLDRGTVKNGILTCHWHHARFDLSSGGTFDPFADDVRSFPVSVEDGAVWVNPNPPEPDPIERWSHRLGDGLEHNIRLVIAKSVLGLNSSEADYRVPLTIGTQFGTTYSAQGWGQAMTMLTCAANIQDSSRHIRARDRGHDIRGGHGQNIPGRGTRPGLLQQGVRDSGPHRLGTRGAGAHQPGEWHGLGEA